MDIRIFQLSDTIGVAKPESIRYIFSELIAAYPHLEFGAHFHTTPASWQEKIEAAYQSGCHRFDGAIKGYGGCPMAKDDLTGNMPTENMIAYFHEVGAATGIKLEILLRALAKAQDVFPPH
jgi:hydroxymethylglutaryl-CoA lyase